MYPGTIHIASVCVDGIRGPASGDPLEKPVRPLRTPNKRGRNFGNVAPVTSGVNRLYTCFGSWRFSALRFVGLARPPVCNILKFHIFVSNCDMLHLNAT